MISAAEVKHLTLKGVKLLEISPKNEEKQPLKTGMGFLNGLYLMN